MQAGDRVAVFADNGPRWLYADLGIQAIGAASVGVYPALNAREAASAIGRSGARVVFCGDQEQVDKLLEGRDEVPGLERIVTFDVKGLHTAEYADAPLETFDDFTARGGGIAGRAPHALRRAAPRRGAPTRWRPSRSPRAPPARCGAFSSVRRARSHWRGPSPRASS